jgi:hypothetical protein
MLQLTFLAALTDAGTYLLPRPASCILFLVNSFNLALAESRRFFVGKFKKDVHALALLCAVAAAANLGRSRIDRYLLFVLCVAPQSNQVEKLMNTASMREVGAHAGELLYYCGRLRRVASPSVKGASRVNA